jgi:hypothetical protein
MRLSIRHCAAVLLVAGGLAVSYGLAESLQGEPCGERAGWMAGNLIAAAFALYLFAGAWMVVARRYVAMAIATLPAWHLLVLSPFLATRCAERARLEQLGEAVGFGFRGFVVATALIALASALALVARDRVPAPDRRAFLRLAIAGATAVSVALVAAAHWIVPRLREAYAAFGADLPAPTLVLVNGYQYWTALPIACLAGLVYVAIGERHSERQLQMALAGTAGLIVLLNLASGALVFSALAPVKTMCGCV